MKYSKSIIALVVMAEAVSKQQQVLAEDWYGATAHPTLYPTYVDDSYWGGDAGSEEHHASYGSKTSKTTSKTGKTSGKGGKGTISKVGKVEPYPTITEGEWSSNYHHEEDSRDDGGGGGWGYEHKNPTILPSFSPTLSPTHEPTLEPTLEPTHSPTHAYIKPVPDPEPHWESKVTKEPEPSWHVEPIPELEPEPHWESKVTKEPEPHWDAAAMEWGVPVTPSESGKGSKTEKTRRGLRRLI